MDGSIEEPKMIFHLFLNSSVLFEYMIIKERI